MASIICAVGFATSALADGCVAGANPSGGAGVSALYGELAKNVAAEPLSVDIATRASGGSCAWVYSVKILTAAGSVAVLDFDFESLGLVGVEGSLDDPEIARLASRLEDDMGKQSPKESVSAGIAAPGDDAKSDGDSSGDGSDGDGSDGEGGDSGSGGSGSGGSGSGGSGSGGSGSGGSEGGDGGDSDGGEGGSDGGSDGGEGGSDGGEGGSDD